MTAAKVIDEIKHLPREEQSEVIQFAFELARRNKLSAPAVEKARRYQSDPQSITELREQYSEKVCERTLELNREFPIAE